MSRNGTEAAPPHVQAVAGSGWRERIATISSMFALVFSGFSLWETSLKQPDVRLFVPPVIQYAAPYNNSNFEVVAIPITFANEGARTGVVMSIELAVTDPRTGETKRFYSADLGRWTMERTRTGAYQPFAPLSLAGRSTRTETVLFYTRGQDEKPEQIIREVGPYRMTVTLDQATVGEIGLLDRFFPSKPAAVTFERELRHYDARAFNQGTLAMYARDWRSSTNAPTP